MGIRYPQPVLLAAVVLLALASCSPGQSVHTSGSQTGAGAPVVFRAATDDPVVFLTIDDGAVRDPAMISVLKKAQVPASLFLTGDYAVDDPGFFRRLRDEATARIEGHSIDHSDLKGQGFADQKRQICRPARSYTKMFGQRPRLFRPPYGSYDETTLRAAVECGVSHVVLWSAEIKDGKMSFAAADRLRPGDIVLMHFGGAFRENVAEFVRQADRSGLHPALLEEYLR
ncbi:polysaccharide deacetylase family protein [Streptomonospora sp. PA3]|uniref:polysaccharide deacetylase family protein n=1 Tax=Streptomonospora sp. PA3 TaxID=2607326 RepID=UPI0012DD42BB|nr:polysaccharide deacetylase family protein [Streptomonospora sp. PA3]MUL41496.1 polysaccharide deacetylase family protein [Streptomonospora sp. PA3]